MKNCFYLFILLTVSFVSCKKGSGADGQPPYTPPPITPPVVDTTTPITPPTVYAGYNLLWNDEFNDANINSSNWNFETGTGVNGDFGTGQLDRATDRNDNAKIVNGVLNSGGGCLAITTQKETYINRNYTSARLTTEGKGSWGPGTRIEARIWAKDVLYKGQGFAFWMMPAEIPAGQTYIMWPQGGEVDIMEYVGSIPLDNLATVHYAWSWENNQYQSWNHGHQGAYYSYADKQVPGTTPAWGGWPVTAGNNAAGSGSFHIYRIDWYADRMEFAIDGNVYHIHYFHDGAAFDNGVADGQDQNGAQMINGKNVFKSEYSSAHFPEWSPFEHKFFMLLTAGVGGNDNMTYGGAIAANAVFPCTTYIDWVRVYKRL
jgi:beta-glucanase (GH16 family)